MWTWWKMIGSDRRRTRAFKGFGSTLHGNLPGRESEGHITHLLSQISPVAEAQLLYISYHFDIKTKRREGEA